MRQQRFGKVGRKGWSILLALCLLALALAPMAEAATKKPTPPPATPTLTDLLNSLPNGVPYRTLAQAILLVQSEITGLVNDVTALKTAVTGLQTAFTALQAQVNALAGQVGTSTTINSGFGTAPILSNFTPGAEPVRLEVSFIPTSGAAPASGSFIMYALVSVETATEINFISAGGDGLQGANFSVVPTAAPIATISTIASLNAIAGSGGTVTFQITELGTTAGKYFVKVIP
jgi:hypothetical protein